MMSVKFYSVTSPAKMAKTNVRLLMRLCENAGPIESCYDLGVNCGGMA